MMDKPSNDSSGPQIEQDSRVEDEDTNCLLDVPSRSIIGSRIGKYSILEVVGRGGTATVYKAKDGVLNRTVAIKFLHPEMIQNSEFIRRFRNEAKVVASLNHPNIVQVYDYSEDPNSQIFLVCEFLEGFSLAELVRRLRVVMEELSLIFIHEILKGLEFAHSKGLIHRDIKPGNILINKDGLVKISDFGLAKFTELKDQDVTRTGLFVGTPSFASPEQIEGANVGARSDIFSLGTLLFVMVTGHHPFKNKEDSTAKVWYRIVHGERPQASALNSTLSPECNEIINRALQSDVGSRFQTATEMREAVENVLVERKIFQHQDEITRFIRSPEAYAEEYRQIVADRCYERASEFYERGQRDQAIRSLSRSMTLDRERFGTSELSLRIIRETKKKRVGPKIGLLLVGLAIVLIGNIFFWRWLKTLTNLPRRSVPVVQSDRPMPISDSPSKSIVPLTQPSVSQSSPAPVVIPRSPKISFYSSAPSPAVITPASGQILYTNRYSAPVSLTWPKDRRAAYYRIDASVDREFANFLFKRYVKSNLMTAKFSGSGSVFWRVAHYGEDAKLFKQSPVYSFERAEEASHVSISDKDRIVIHVDESQPSTTLDFNPYDSRIKLIWNKVPKANRYRYEVARDIQFRKPIFFKTVDVREGFIENGISDPGLYYWRVSLLDEYDEAFYISEPKTLKIHLQPNARTLIIETPKNGQAVGVDLVTEGLVPADHRLSINGEDARLIYSKEKGRRFKHHIRGLKKGNNLLVYVLSSSQSRGLFYRVVSKYTTQH